jgi:hypothetical protein
MGKWLLQSLDFFKRSVENSKLVALKTLRVLRVVTFYEFLPHTGVHHTTSLYHIVAHQQQWKPFLPPLLPADEPT